ncbi:hypothetical protein [Microbispora sp. CA-102843]|uniref:hypothetical protein n=1 Tax=Microbispora sp. CA-102843 TaxID=3239952 RepID=UPI003D90100A
MTSRLATDVPVLVLVGGTHVGKTSAACALANGHTKKDPQHDMSAYYFRCLDQVNPDHPMSATPRPYFVKASYAEKASSAKASSCSR